MSFASRCGFHSLALFCALSTGGSAMAEPWAEKMFSQTSHDFRTVGRGTKAEHHFNLKNLYQEEVHIASVRTSCGCTTPIITQQTLKSFESGAIVAKFNTETHIGQKSAVLTVVFDRPYYAEVQLSVRGNIRTDITFSPPEVNFGELAEGQTSEQEVVISYTGSTGWEIKDVRSHCTDLVVTLTAPQRSPGLVRYRMNVASQGGLTAGDIRERLTLVTNDTRFPTIEMAVSGRVRAGLEVSPAALSLGTIRSGETIEKRLVVRGEREFSVSDVVCGDKRFSFELPEGRKKLHFVKVNFAAGDDEAVIAQKIRIVSDWDDGRSAECIASGVIVR